MNPEPYTAPWWLPGGHLQTIYARSLAARYPVHYRRERWHTPDGDFIDLDWCDSHGDDAKLLILFHGLEGSSRSHYAVSLMALAQRQGWLGAVAHFRGCSGEANILPRSYHCGDSAEIDWIVRRLKNEFPRSPIYLVGVSLGANALLKWLGESGAAAATLIERAVAVSAPVDLTESARVLDLGPRKLLYTRHFLRTMKRKLRAKIDTHQLGIETAAIDSCTTFRQFDDLYTAPIHGFADANDYWTRASSKPWLKRIAVPTLLISARNDPFLPPAALPKHDEVSPAVQLEFPRTGGHVGFVSGALPGSLDWLPNRIHRFVLDHH